MGSKSNRKKSYTAKKTKQQQKRKMAVLIALSSAVALSVFLGYLALSVTNLQEIGQSMQNTSDSLESRELTEEETRIILEKLREDSMLQNSLVEKKCNPGTKMDGGQCKPIMIKTTPDR